MSAYTVHANPCDDNYLVTAGRDPHVRMYDRRFASEENNKPIKKYCPHHLVSIFSTFHNCIYWEKIFISLHIVFFVQLLKARIRYLATEGE